MTLALEPGSNLLHYRVVAPIGAGGMGEVYKAVDTTLGREVAIKVLPTAVAGDAERLARFEREARLLASLNHPNIAVVYGLHTVGQASFLAMELVPGEDLGARLERGPFAVDEALAVARQIADALAAAHEHGVVHRDLKPANVRLTSDDRVKVLDFGLAKAMEATSTSATELAHSPTLSYSATAEGMILGTAAYMSPEQARGRPVDRRSDVWAFGCVVWELLTGERLFAGETVSDTIAALLRKEIPWSALPAETPPAVVRLLRRCLERDPARRLRDLGDARLELDEPATEGAVAAAAVATPAPVAPPSRLPWAVAVVATLVTLTALGFAWRQRSAPTRASAERPIRFTIESPQIAPVSAGDVPRIAISPRGDRLFWVAVQGGHRVLVSRALGELDATAIPGSEGLYGIAAIAPGGDKVAVVAISGIRWLPLQGGTSSDLTSYVTFRGAALGADGTFWFSPSTEAGILRVPQSGHEGTAVVGPDAAAEERSFRWPILLPDGETLLYTVATARIQSFAEARIEAWSSRTGKRIVVVEHASYPLFLAPDRLLFARGGALFEVQLDLERMKPVGEPRVVQSGVVTYPLSGMADAALAADGTLAWVAGPVATLRHRLIEVDGNGRVRQIVPEEAGYMTPRVSPDGKSIAIDVDQANAQIWIYNRERGTRVRLTESWSNNGPIWSRDGQSVFYSSSRGSRFHLFEQRLDGGAPVSRFESEEQVLIDDLAVDGKSLLYNSKGDVFEVPLDGSAPPKPVLDAPFWEGEARLSPDGRWLAFVSDESGHAEVYLQPYPGPGRKHQVSTGGGYLPAWSPDGREIVFVTGAEVVTGAEGDEIVAVPVALGPSPEVGHPHLLYRLPGRPQWMDLAPDGKLVAAIASDEPEQPSPIVVARGWEKPAAPPR